MVIKGGIWLHNGKQVIFKNWFLQLSVLWKFRKGRKARASLFSPGLLASLWTCSLPFYMVEPGEWPCYCLYSPGWAMGSLPHFSLFCFFRLPQCGPPCCPSLLPCHSWGSAWVRWGLCLLPPASPHLSSANTNNIGKWTAGYHVMRDNMQIVDLIIAFTRCKIKCPLRALPWGRSAWALWRRKMELTSD